MPSYDYKCDDCDTIFEVQKNMNEMLYTLVVTAKEYLFFNNTRGDK